MKGRWAIPFGVFCGFLAAGLVFVASTPPRGEPVQLLPPPTPAPILVFVTGAVVQPGLQSLPPGSRVNDAIALAGGLLPEANASVLNLAALVTDGDRIYVPLSTTTDRFESPADPSYSLVTDLININRASQAELESLPGIGPVTAGNIIAYRDQNGGFATIESLLDVPGIGPKTFTEIQNLITIED